MPGRSQGHEKLPEDQVNKVQTDIAKNFAHNFFSTLKNGKTYEFKDEATEILAQSLTPEKQTQFYQYFSGEFGTYQSLEYAETWKYSGQETMIIVRFKGICDGDKVTPEIRVVLDKDNKVAGFWLKPWETDLK
jgi:hypothetical protein